MFLLYVKPDRRRRRLTVQQAWELTASFGYIERERWNVGAPRVPPREGTDSCRLFLTRLLLATLGGADVQTIGLSPL